jgi:hypothetical protein
LIPRQFATVILSGAHRGLVAMPRLWARSRSRGVKRAFEPAAEILSAAKEPGVLCSSLNVTSSLAALGISLADSRFAHVRNQLNFDSPSSRGAGLELAQDDRLETMFQKRPTACQEEKILFRYDLDLTRAETHEALKCLRVYRWSSF